MNVDSSKIGRVIGRGGATIRDITEKSGAKIDIGRVFLNKNLKLAVFYPILIRKVENHKVNFSKGKNFKFGLLSFHEKLTIMFSIFLALFFSLFSFLVLWFRPFKFRLSVPSVYYPIGGLCSHFWIHKKTNSI